MDLIKRTTCPWPGSTPRRSAGPYDAVRMRHPARFRLGRGGYILSCCDHYFETPPENIRIYADAARACVY